MIVANHFKVFNLFSVTFWVVSQSETADFRFRVNNGGPLSPRARMEQEKRLRREIANSNERRRMQSINSGFQTLKALLPRRDGEKMSKASVFVSFLKRPKMTTLLHCPWLFLVYNELKLV